MLYIASDHAGYELKEKLKPVLEKSTALQDLGTESTDSCDYPVFAARVAERVAGESGALGLLICGSGIGMSIAANKFKGIRAACVSEAKSAELSRQHNDANILCIGSRILDFKTAQDCVNAFLKASFDRSSPRHQKRIDLIASFENRK